MNNEVNDQLYIYTHRYIESESTFKKMIRVNCFICLATRAAVKLSIRKRVINLVINFGQNFNPPLIMYHISMYHLQNPSTFFFAEKQKVGSKRKRKKLNQRLLSTKQSIAVPLHKITTKSNKCNVLVTPVPKKKRTEREKHLVHAHHHQLRWCLHLSGGRKA